MLPEATFEDYCVWNRCTSDRCPTRAEYHRFTVSELQTIKSEADRIRRITAEHEARVEKAKRMAARVK